jgi:hypothetical protein
VSHQHQLKVILAGFSAVNLMSKMKILAKWTQIGRLEQESSSKLIQILAVLTSIELS